MFANCRFGLKVQCPPVNHKVVGSRHDYHDYVVIYIFWLWVKCGIAECGMRKVKCGIENAE